MKMIKLINVLWKKNSDVMYIRQFVVTGMGRNQGKQQRFICSCL